ERIAAGSESVSKLSALAVLAKWDAGTSPPVHEWLTQFEGSSELSADVAKGALAIFIAVRDPRALGAAARVSKVNGDHTPEGDTYDGVARRALSTLVRGDVRFRPDGSRLGPAPAL